MRHYVSGMLCCFLVLASDTALAQAPVCPPALSWADARAVQNTIKKEGKIAHAEMRVYLNATVWRLQVDGTSAGMMQMASADGRDIVLMRNQDRGGPATFGEIAMLLDVPMAHGAMRGLAKPCDLADGETRHIDGQDFLLPGSGTAEKNAVSGTVSRDGLRVTYTMLAGEPSAEQVEGTWDASPALHAFPLSTDVGGWSVYRNNTKLLAPAGKPTTLAALLASIGFVPATR